MVRFVELKNIFLKKFQNPIDKTAGYYYNSKAR